MVIPTPRTPCVAPPDPSARRANLADFGWCSGQPCAAQSLRAAADWLRHGGGTLIIPPGLYPVQAVDGAHWDLTGIRDGVIEAAGAVLLCHDIAHGVRIRRCRRLALRGLTIDWGRPMASLGRITGRRGKLRIILDDRDRLELPVAGITSWDDSANSWALDGHEWYHPEGSAGASHNLPRAGADGLALPESCGDLASGDRVVVRHWIYHANAIDWCGRGNADLHFESVIVHTAPGHAFVGYGCDRGVRLSGCRIARDPRQLVSVTADGCHVGACGGDVVIEDCDFAHQGDDSVNIHGVWMRVAGVAGRRVRLSSRWISHAREQMGVGHHLGFFREGDLDPLGAGRVTSVTAEGDAVVVGLDRPLPRGLKRGAFVADLERGTARFRISGNYFHDHRARGMLVQARDGMIVGNRVERVQMAALNLTTDCAYWQEGYGCADVVVAGNAFVGCNHHHRERGSRGVHLACLNLLVETPKGLGPRPLHERIALLGNIFADTAGPAILVASAREVLVAGNRVTRAQQRPCRKAGSELGLLHGEHAALLQGCGTAAVTWVGNVVDDRPEHVNGWA